MAERPASCAALHEVLPRLAQLTSATGCITRTALVGATASRLVRVSETGGVISERHSLFGGPRTPPARAKAEAQVFGAASAAAGAASSTWSRNPDVLRTLVFQRPSALLPTPGLAPYEGAADLATWYPTSVLVTGFHRHHLFLGLARMTMLPGPWRHPGQRMRNRKRKRGAFADVDDPRPGAR